MAKIDFEAKNNRELILLTAQTVNSLDERLEKQNGKVARHDRNLIIVDVILVVIGGILIYFFTGQVPAIPFW